VDQPLYLRPAAVEEALAALSARKLSVLAGGTDFYPAWVGRLVREDILDISRIAQLRGIAREDRHWRIGALTTWTDLLRAPLPALFDGLKLAAREVGGVQIQNAGTVAGNCCNASPAADGVPCLLALDAEVELASLGQRRRIPLSEFIVGSRKTARRPDELVTALIVPDRGPRARSTFLKLGARRYLVISIAMVAVTIDFDDAGKVIGAAVAVGACSPVARRIPALEARLIGRERSELAAQVRSGDLSVLAPITDVRGTAEYRLEAAGQLIQRALRELQDE
jgi:CO/xanthine dehydrogenase FAD-binding subunit